MNARQKKFAQEYLKNPNAKEAALKAGYSEKTAKVKGSQLLNNKEVKKYLEQKRDIVEEQTGVDLKWCIERLKNISDRCMQVAPVLDKKGNQVMIENIDGVEVPAFIFDSAGANRSTELIGRHLGIFEKDNAQSKPEVVIKQNVIKLANGDEISI